MTSLRSLASLAVALVFFARDSWACATCFGAPGSKMTQGTSNGVLFMIAIIALVQAGFVALFWTFWRRSRAMRRHREQFRLLEGGAL